MQRHIIHKQTVTLEMSESKDSNMFQDKVSHMLHNGVSEAMEAVFDRISVSGEVIRIDKLVLNLGEITPADFEAEFKNKLIDELTKALAKSGGSSGDGQHMTVLRQTESMMAMLQYFLVSGRLPWYAGAKRMNEWEDEIIEKFSDAEWKEFGEWIAAEYTNTPAIIERFVWQFSDRFIAAFLSQAGLKVLWGVEPELIFADLIVLIKQLFGGQIADARVAAWREIIEAAISKKVFARLLRDVIEKRLKNASNAPLLAILKKKGLAAQFKTSIAKKAIQELQQDEVFLKKIEKHAENDIKSKAKKQAANKAEEVNLKEPPKEKKGGEKRKVADEEGEFIFVQNCGIVLLAPFLKPYFADLGLLDNKDFVDEEAQKRAALLLHYLATGDTEVAEFDLAFQKLLCGMPMDEPLPNSIELTEKEREETGELLKAVTQHWAPLNNTSNEGLRTTFLQREGKIQYLDPNWKLQVEHKTVDILLDKLPWGYSTIRLPWINYMIHVEWY